MPSSKTLIAFSLCLSASGWALAAEPLLTPQQLAALLPQAQASATVRVIDIRDPKSFAENHIPGAVNAPTANGAALPPTLASCPTTPSWLRCCSRWA